MKRFKLFITATAVMFFGAFVLVPVSSVAAIDPLNDACRGNSSAEICKRENRGEQATSLIETLTNVLLFVVGLLSVVMIIVGGILYTISSGDAGKVTKAKNTLTYAIVGLVVSFLAYAIVNWVLDVF